MELNFAFFFNSILLGIGLAMDAFSVSLANGLNEPDMKPNKMGVIAGVFGFFQGLMPLLGWVCIHTIVQYFKFFEKLIPFIALGLLAYIGGKMIYESLKGSDECECGSRICFTGVLLQGIATSIDALSVGFTIADYKFPLALLSALIIGVITFAICFAGIFIGKKLGTGMACRAGVFGGSILIFIGLEIFIMSFIK